MHKGEQTIHKGDLRRREQSQCTKASRQFAKATCDARSLANARNGELPIRKGDLGREEPSQCAKAICQFAKTTAVPLEGLMRAC